MIYHFKGLLALIPTNFKEFAEFFKNCRKISKDTLTGVTVPIVDLFICRMIILTDEVVFSRLKLTVC